ncbi:MAG: S8 family peptidase [Planctomycetota bacterium]
MSTFQSESIDETIELGHDANDVQELLFSVSNTDAGSTRSTAYDLGDLRPESQQYVDQRALSGSLSYYDRMDVFRFVLPERAEVDLSLGRMWRNADLLLVDAAGQGIASSRNAGSAAEHLTLELAAGVYYVGVQARSFWGTSYRFDVTAEFETPTASPATPESPASSSPGEVSSGVPASDSNGSVSAFADVPYFGGSLDWNVNAVNAPESWAAGFTGQGITVAVVDTGVDLDHPDLVRSIFVNPGEIAGNGIDDDQNGFIDDVHGFDFVGNDANPDDGNGHGTHVAGTIAAANNGFGATGIAPDATILPVKVLGDNGSGSNFSVAAGIRYAADMGAEIINLSLGGGYNRAVQSAIDYANSLGSMVIAAAGNEGSGVPSFPAQLASAFSNVLSVGAHDSGNRSAGFSNRVGNSSAVQVDAPGVRVYSTLQGGRYGSLSGTSMATPHVAGVAALALSANSDLSPSALRDLIVSGTTAQAIGSDAVGILNAATTVAFAAAGLTAVGTQAQTTSSSFLGNARSTRAISVEQTAAHIDLAEFREANVGLESYDIDSQKELMARPLNFAETSAQSHAPNWAVLPSEFAATDRVFAGSESDATGIRMREEPLELLSEVEWARAGT